MSQPLGYFLTWTTYGTWLPGDRRGWVAKAGKKTDPIEAPRSGLERYAARRMTESMVRLTASEQQLVVMTIRDRCAGLNWFLHALSVRSNHVHIVLTAGDAAAGKAMGVLKAAATQTLNKEVARRDRWWTKAGSKRVLYSRSAMQAAIRYACNQDDSWKKKG